MVKKCIFMSLYLELSLARLSTLGLFCEAIAVTQ